LNLLRKILDKERSFPNGLYGFSMEITDFIGYMQFFTTKNETGSFHVSRTKKPDVSLYKNQLRMPRMEH